MKRTAFPSSRFLSAQVVSVICTTLLLLPVIDARAASGITSRRTDCATATNSGDAICLSWRRVGADGRPAVSAAPVLGSFTPTDLKDAYAIGAGSSGLQAAPVVAIVGAYASPTAASDLDTYRRTFELGDLLPGQLQQVSQRGSSSLPPADPGWALEEMTDLEMVSALCPQCKLLYVGADSASLQDLAAAVDTAVRAGASVVTNSYGAPEFKGQLLLEQHYNHPGTAIVAASGDSGYGAMYPGSSQFVTSVGGTALSRDEATPRRWSEKAWSESGSGCSSYTPKPSWQHDEGCKKRTVADVAMVADPDTGVAVFNTYDMIPGYGWTVVGGTSVGAPLVGALYALSGSRSEIPASRLYATNASLNDITDGATGKCPKARAYLCAAQVGYDGPTGVGSPRGAGAF